MTYVVIDNCQRCRFTDCVTVCPVDAFHADEDMLVIDPDACIHCGACEPMCPVQAIHEDTKMPAGKESWTDENARRSPGLPVINSKQAPLPTAEARKAELGF